MTETQSTNTSTSPKRCVPFEKNICLKTDCWITDLFLATMLDALVYYQNCNAKNKNTCECNVMG